MFLLLWAAILLSHTSCNSADERLEKDREVEGKELILVSHGKRLPRYQPIDSNTVANMGGRTIMVGMGGPFFANRAQYEALYNSIRMAADDEAEKHRRIHDTIWIKEECPLKHWRDVFDSDTLVYRWDGLEPGNEPEPEYNWLRERERMNIIMPGTDTLCLSDWNHLWRIIDSLARPADTLSARDLRVKGCTGCDKVNLYE